MNKSKFVALMIALVGLAAAVPAGAQVSLYFGGQAGQARANEDICPAVNATYGGGATTAYACDRTGRGAWGGFMGFMFNPYFGIEGGYKDLGTIVELSDFTTGAQVATGKTKLGDLNAVAALPVQRLTLFIKGGGYRAKTTVSSPLANYAYGYTTQWTIGGGLSYDVWKHFGIRLDWTRYNNLGAKEVGFRTDMDVGMVGAYFKF